MVIKYTKKAILLLFAMFLLLPKLYSAEGAEQAVNINSELEKAITKDQKTAKINIKYGCLKPLFIKDLDVKEIKQNDEVVATLEMWGINGECTWSAVYDIEQLKQIQQGRLQGKKDNYVPTMEYTANILVKFKVKGLKNAKLKQDVSYFVVFADKETEEILSKQSYKLKLNTKVKQGKESFTQSESFEILYTIPASKVVDLEILLGFEE